MLFHKEAFAGRRFLVTGSASGIGAGIVQLLREHGAAVCGISRHENNGGRGHDEHILLDLSNDIAQIVPTISSHAAEYGTFDGIVHCAGLQNIAPLRGWNDVKYDDLFNVNLHTALALAKVFDKKSVRSGNGGSIVLVSSISAISGQPGLSAYAASKSSLLGLSKSMAAEFAPKKVRVNVVLPGLVKTPLLTKWGGVYTEDYLKAAEEQYPLGLGKVEDVANTVLFLLSDASKWMTGGELVVDGGFTL